MSTQPGQGGAAAALWQIAEPRTVPSLAISSGQLMTGVGWITAISFANPNATTPGLYYLGDGTDATAPVIATMGAPAGQSGSVNCGAPGIPFTRGLYLIYKQGALQIAVTYIPRLDPNG